MSKEAWLADMPRYRCHKVVQALKIANIDQVHMDGSSPTRMRLHFEEPGFEPLTVDQAYLSHAGPAIGGYFVMYADGYQSYSPAKAFEDGYTLAEGLPDPGEEHEAYDLDMSLRTAKLWRAGKLIGGDPYAVIQGLLTELERLQGKPA